MVDPAAYLNPAGLVMAGLVSGVAIGGVRAAYPTSTPAKLLLAIAFILPLSYLLSKRFRAGLLVLSGAAVGVVVYGLYAR